MSQPRYKNAKPKQINLVTGLPSCGITTKLLRFAAKQLANKGIDRLMPNDSKSPICFFSCNQERTEHIRSILEKTFDKSSMSGIKLYASNTPSFVTNTILNLISVDQTPSCCIVDDCEFSDFEALCDGIIPLPNCIFWEVGVR